MKKKKYIIIAVGVAVILGATAFGIHFASKPSLPNTYAELIALPPEKIEQVDIALMNLLCAEGLPGTENLNIDACLASFDQWAELVKQNEQKYLVRFCQHQQQYDNSYAKFQAVNLGLTLKEDLKCGYNQELVKSGAMNDIRSTRFFRDSSDLFLHGFIEKRTGSCSSLPVLMLPSVGGVVIRCISSPAKVIYFVGGMMEKNGLILKQHVPEWTANQITTTCGGLTQPIQRKLKQRNF